MNHLDALPTGYEYITPPPGGTKLTLLTVGNVQVTGEFTGVWLNNGRFKAWAPLLKRNKTLEKELGIL